mmetsp:Transcript_17959/g.24899  ORF Transcript_17959/g.24899 Transcript_17959/m.24899 type:complete len:223 (-) Transcript_17959:580-1248(-)
MISNILDHTCPILRRFYDSLVKSNLKFGILFVIYIMRTYMAVSAYKNRIYQTFISVGNGLPYLVVCFLGTRCHLLPIDLVNIILLLLIREETNFNCSGCRRKPNHGQIDKCLPNSKARILNQFEQSSKATVNKCSDDYAASTRILSRPSIKEDEKENPTLSSHTLLRALMKGSGLVDAIQECSEDDLYHNMVAVCLATESIPTWLMHQQVKKDDTATKLKQL